MSRASGIHVHRLVRWQRIMLYWTGGLLMLTGAAWLAIHYTIGAGAGELPHPLEALCLRLHGLAAFVAIFLFGALAAGHIPQGWLLTNRRRWARQRRSGLLLCVGGASLVLTGYLLYYFAPENMRAALGWIHTALGVSMCCLAVSHRRGRLAVGKD